MINSFLERLFKPVDSAILIYFRFFTGIFLSWEILNSLALGDFHEYTSPSFHFTYLFFEWIKPWPKWGMVLHFAITIGAGFCVAFGFKQRVNSILLFLGYTLLFLMEKSEYINHLYLYCLISFWLIFLPDLKKKEAPAWYLYLILFHISLVYFFAGVAKLNTDWLSGNTMKYFLSGHQDYHPLQAFYKSHIVHLIFAYGGVLFDLAIVPLLIYRKTRPWAFIASVVFHLSNVLMFGLASFPWFSLMVTSMFFDPSWPRKIKPFSRFFTSSEVLKSKPFGRNEKCLVTVLSFYVLLHTLVPLRHFLYDGNPSWTEDGHQFAWRMKLRSKSGETFFYVMDRKTKKVQLTFPQQILTAKQYRDMMSKPDSILQFAHYLRDEFRSKKNMDVAVYVSAQISLNGGPKQDLIQRQTDLAKEKRKLSSYDWVVPLKIREEPERKLLFSTF